MLSTEHKLFSKTTFWYWILIVRVFLQGMMLDSLSLSGSSKQRLSDVQMRVLSTAIGIGSFEIDTFNCCFQMKISSGHPDLRALPIRSGELDRIVISWLSRLLRIQNFQISLVWSKQRRHQLHWHVVDHLRQPFYMNRWKGLSHQIDLACQQIIASAEEKCPLRVCYK